MPHVNKPSNRSTSTLFRNVDLTTQISKLEIVKGVACRVQDGKERMGQRANTLLQHLCIWKFFKCMYFFFPFYYYFLTSLLEYNCFTMLC